MERVALCGYSVAGRGLRRKEEPLPQWLDDLLEDPWKSFRRVLDALLDFLSDLLPVVLGVITAALFLLLAGKLWRRLRERQVAANARRIRIHPPPEVDSARAQVLWMGLHALIRPWWRRVLSGQPHVAWEVSAQGDEAEVSIWVPKAIPPGLVERAMEVAWPGARAEETAEDPVAELRRGDAGRIEACELLLAEHEWFPVGGEPKDNPLELALAAAGGLGSTERAVIQVVARPATSRARHRLVRAAQVLRVGGKPGRWAWGAGRGRSLQRPRADPGLEVDVRSIMAKAASPSWHCMVRVAVRSSSRRASRGRIHGLAGAFAMFEGRNGFRRRRIRGGLRAMRGRRLSRTYLLSVPELAQVASLPATGTLAGFEASGARTAPPPRALPDAGRVLGEADHPGARRSVALAVEDARHHVHVIGETGTGKSTLLANLVLQDAAAGRSAVVIDPKGDLVEAVLERLPAGAEGRTCVIDPDDRKWTVGLNVLAGDDPDLLVDHVVAVFKRIYEPWWGPRTDDIMRAACLTLTQIPGTTLAEVPMLLTSFVWRHAIREQLNDIVGVGAFWDLYERMQEQQRSQHIAPLMNKLRAFLLRGPVRAIVGQADPELDIAEFLDSGGLLLVRIPKGTLGEETSRLLGAFVIARVWQACMRRARSPESHRPDTALYVDEVHNYLVLPRSFEDLLAEARGYRLSLILAHQHLGQLPREVRDALGANARTKVVFTCSPVDAFHLQRHFAPRLTDFDLSHLAAFQAACRPSVDGGHGAGFTFRTAAVPEGSKARARAVRTASERFARLRTEVEEDIANRQVRPELWLLPRDSDAKDPSGGRSVDRSEGRSGGRPTAARPPERGVAGRRPR